MQDNASDDCGHIDDQHDDTDGEDDVVADHQIHEPDGLAPAPGDCRLRDAGVGDRVVGQ